MKRKGYKLCSHPCIQTREHAEIGDRTCTNAPYSQSSIQHDINLYIEKSLLGRSPNVFYMVILNATPGGLLMTWCSNKIIWYRWRGWPERWFLSAVFNIVWREHALPESNKDENELNRKVGKWWTGAHPKAKTRNKKHSVKNERKVEKNQRKTDWFLWEMNR